MLQFIWGALLKDFQKNILNYVNILKIYYEQKIFKTGADELEGDSVSEKGGV